MCYDPRLIVLYSSSECSVPQVSFLPRVVFVFRARKGNPAVFCLFLASFFVLFCAQKVRLSPCFGILVELVNVRCHLGENIPSGRM